MEGRFYKIAIIAVATAILAFGVWYLFFKKDSEKQTSTSGGIRGGGVVYRGGDTVNISGNSTFVSGGSSTNQTNVNTNQANNQNLTSKYGSSRSSMLLINVNEQNNTYLETREGAKLMFDPASPQEANKHTPLNIAGYSSGSYSQQGKGKSQKQKSDQSVCIAIVNEIIRDKDKILALTPEAQQSYILDRLRYIPNFGGASAIEQQKIVTALIKDLESGNKIDPIAYCKKISDLNQGLIYLQCLQVIEGIIVDKVTDKDEILKRLLAGIPSFIVLDATSQNLVVDMIVDGMNEGNLNKEKICSFIQSLIIDSLEDMQLYKQCIAIINELSQENPLTPAIIDSYLKKIPGYSSLTKAQKDEITRDILNDPKTDGMLDAERHCAKIVSYILANIYGSIAYQQCLIILEELANSGISEPNSVAQKVSEIPGFIYAFKRFARKGNSFQFKWQLMTEVLKISK